MEVNAFERLTFRIQDNISFGDRGEDLGLSFYDIQAERTEFVGNKCCRCRMPRLAERPVSIGEDEGTAIFHSGGIQGILEGWRNGRNPTIPSPLLAGRDNICQKSGKSCEEGSE